MGMFSITTLLVSSYQELQTGGKYSHAPPQTKSLPITAE